MLGWQHPQAATVCHPHYSELSSLLMDQVLNLPLEYFPHAVQCPSELLYI